MGDTPLRGSDPNLGEDGREDERAGDGAESALGPEAAGADRAVGGGSERGPEGRTLWSGDVPEDDSEADCASEAAPENSLESDPDPALAESSQEAGPAAAGEDSRDEDGEADDESAGRPGSSASAEPDPPTPSWRELDEKLPEPQVVTLKMLAREYQIKSDQPALVRFLAEEINREGETLRSKNPRLGPGQFDWAVQVAFRLALRFHQSRRALDELESRLDREAADLAAKIDEQLLKIENRPGEDQEPDAGDCT